MLLGLLGLGGCGFAPIYGSGGGLRNQIIFESSNNVAGFRLREQLEERLGRGDNARFRLVARPRTSERAAAIDTDGDTTRFNIIGSADWALTDLGTGKQIDTGKVEAFTSYATTASTIATQSTRDDALERLAVILADLIVSRLLVLTPDLTQ